MNFIKLLNFKISQSFRNLFLDRSMELGQMLLLEGQEFLLLVSLLVLYGLPLLGSVDNAINFSFNIIDFIFKLNLLVLKLLNCLQ